MTTPRVHEIQTYRLHDEWTDADAQAEEQAIEDALLAGLVLPPVEPTVVLSLGEAVPWELA